MVAWFVLLTGSVPVHPSYMKRFCNKSTDSINESNWYKNIIDLFLLAKPNQKKHLKELI